MPSSAPSGSMPMAISDSCSARTASLEELALTVEGSFSDSYWVGAAVGVGVGVAVTFGDGVAVAV